MVADLATEECYTAGILVSERPSTSEDSVTFFHIRNDRRRSNNQSFDADQFVHIYRVDQ